VCVSFCEVITIQKVLIQNPFFGLRREWRALLEIW
jgi:hypothetical protein